MGQHNSNTQTIWQLSDRGKKSIPALEINILRDIQPTRFHTWFPHRVPVSELLDLCAVLAGDGLWYLFLSCLISVQYWQEMGSGTCF